MDIKVQNSILNSIRQTSWRLVLSLAAVLFFYQGCAAGDDPVCGDGFCDIGERDSCPMDCADGGNNCTPRTCEELGKECGTWSDGCGSQVECDLCEPPANSVATCNEEGVCGWECEPDYCDGDGDPENGCELLADKDGDGYTTTACGGNDCNDEDENINPGIIDDCTASGDTDCSGEDRICDEQSQVKVAITHADRRFWVISDYDKWPQDCTDINSPDYNQSETCVFGIPTGFNYHFNWYNMPFYHDPAHRDMQAEINRWINHNINTIHLFLGVPQECLDGTQPPDSCASGLHRFYERHDGYTWQFDEEFEMQFRTFLKYFSGVVVISLYDNFWIAHPEQGHFDEFPLTTVCSLNQWSDIFSNECAKTRTKARIKRFIDLVTGNIHGNSYADGTTDNGENYWNKIAAVDLMNEVNNYWEIDAQILSDWLVEMRSYFRELENLIGLSPSILYASWIDNAVIQNNAIAHNQNGTVYTDLISPHFYWHSSDQGLNYLTNILGSQIHISDAIGTHLLKTDTGLGWCSNSACSSRIFNPQDQNIPIFTTEWGPIFAEELYQNPDQTYFRMVSLSAFASGDSGFTLRWPYTGGQGSSRYGMPDEFLNTLQGFVNLGVHIHTFLDYKWGFNLRNLTMKQVETAGGISAWVKNSSGDIIQKSVCTIGDQCGIGLAATSNARCLNYDDNLGQCTSYATGGNDAGNQFLLYMIQDYQQCNPNTGTCPATPEFDAREIFIDEVKATTYQVRCWAPLDYAQGNYTPINTVTITPYTGCGQANGKCGCWQSGIATCFNLRIILEDVCSPLGVNWPYDLWEDRIIAITPAL